MGYKEYLAKQKAAGKPAIGLEEYEEKHQKYIRTNRGLINDSLQSIKEDVEILLTMLPEEQQHIWSECRKIDSLANALYNKYVK